MKLKHIIAVLVTALVISVGMNIRYAITHDDPSSSGSEQAGKQMWTCGMHPNVVMDHPDNCPICGMKLTPMRGGGDAGAAPSREIHIDPSTTQNIGLRLAASQRRNLQRTVRATGVVAVDESRQFEVNLRFSGWIEILYANQTGAPVQRGDRLFDVYSPDLISAQQEYLVAYRAPDSPQSALVLTAARDKLLNWGVTEDQIHRLEMDVVVPRTLTYHSPVSGIVMTRAVVEGGAIAAGSTVLSISDLSAVWVQAQIYEYEIPWIETGMMADVFLPSDPSRVYRGEVKYIYPYLDPNTRTATVRLSLANADLSLKPEMYVDVDLITRPRENVVSVPREAIVHSGKRDVVFIAKGNGTFEPREIRVGLEADDYYTEVTSGLREGENVVVSAQFLLDSESQLQEALLKLSGGSPIEVAPAATHAEHDHSGSKTEGESERPTANTAKRAQPEKKPEILLDASGATMSQVYSAKNLYRCPQHSEIVTGEENTRCPLCQTPLSKMPAAEVKTLRNDQPYGCVMCPIVVPESRKDLKCPICEMKLTPIENIGTPGN